jgi:hypothetical protein
MKLAMRIVIAAALILGSVYSTQFVPANTHTMMASGDPAPSCPPSGCRGGGVNQ